MLLSYCERLTDFFISQCGLPETRRSWYIYALQTRISMFLSTAGMMLLGCLVATPYQVICFLVGILSLRRRLGGYHAKTPLRCLFLSIGVSILCLSILRSDTELFVIAPALSCSIANRKRPVNLGQMKKRGLRF